MYFSNGHGRHALIKGNSGHREVCPWLGMLVGDREGTIPEEVTWGCVVLSRHPRGPGWGGTAHLRASSEYSLKGFGHPPPCSPILPHTWSKMGESSDPVALRGSPRDRSAEPFIGSLILW